jgi:hypothetical protein
MDKPFFKILVPFPDLLKFIHLVVVVARYIKNVIHNSNYSKDLDYTKNSPQSYYNKLVGVNFISF